MYDASMKTKTSIIADRNVIGIYFMTVETGDITYENGNFEYNLIGDSMFILNDATASLSSFEINRNNITTNDMFYIEETQIDRCN